MSLPAKPFSELRVAVVCNWNDKCGISTYTKFLVQAMSPKVKEIAIFSEVSREQTEPDADNVIRCWSRGSNMRPAMTRLLEWKPDFIIIQHEYGIFPNACYWMQMMQMIDEIPYVVVTHSVYDHLDKAVYSSVIKNIICHTEQGKNCLRSVGNSSNIYVVPHGCIVFDKVEELFNIMQNPYTILQFGFGFRYKGVERMLEAVASLKHNDPKFKDIFYCFMLSTNDHNKRAHSEYYDTLLHKIRELDIEDNTAIIRQYNSDQMLNHHLREFKLAVFPYISNADNIVYGSSGAARVALSNGIPVVCSESHLFDDLEGIVPRPASVEALVKEIDEIFSNSRYRNELLQRGRVYVTTHSWDNTASSYLEVYSNIMASSN